MNGMFRIARHVVFKADAGGGAGGGSAGGAAGSASGAAGGAGSGGTGDAVPLVYDAWFAGQSKEIQDLISGNEKGLKSALQTERDTRSTLEKELRDAASKLGKGSEAETKLLATADQLAETTRRADFYEAGVAAGVNNLKLAYLAAKSDDLFDKRGQPDFAALKKGYPELFGVPLKLNGAGDGTNQNLPTGKGGMNAFIRGASGHEAA